MIYIHHICHFDPLPVDLYTWTPLKCCGGEAQTSLALRVDRKLRKGIIQWDIEGIIPRIIKFFRFCFSKKNSIEQLSWVINQFAVSVLGGPQGDRFLVGNGTFS